VNDELMMMWKWSWPNLRYYPGICLEGLRKITNNISQDSLSPGRDLNLGPPKYEGVNHSTTTFGNSLATVLNECFIELLSFQFPNPISCFHCLRYS
jgi:hypothetical protein